MTIKGTNDDIKYKIPPPNKAKKFARTRFPKNYSGKKPSITSKKKSQPTGRARIYVIHPQIDIKINKCMIGHIDPPNIQTFCDSFKIRLSVKKRAGQPNDNPYCDWKWMTVTTEFKTEQEAKQWIKYSILTITDSFISHSLS